MKGIFSLQRCSRHILHHQPTGQWKNRSRSDHCLRKRTPAINNFMTTNLGSTYTRNRFTHENIQYTQTLLFNVSALTSKCFRITHTHTHTQTVDSQVVYGDSISNRGRGCLFFSIALIRLERYEFNYSQPSAMGKQLARLEFLNLWQSVSKNSNQLYFA